MKIITVGDLNSIEKVFGFLKEKYLDPSLKSHVEATTGHKFENAYTQKPKSNFVQHQTDKGIVEIVPCIHLKG